MDCRMLEHPAGNLSVDRLFEVMVVDSEIERVFRNEAGRVLAALVGKFGDLALAEDCLHEAFVRALERWAGDGIPRVPAAWLMRVASNLAIDHLRRGNPAGARTGRAPAARRLGGGARAAGAHAAA
jgi:predicted RNA polymerase sigma factor